MFLKNISTYKTLNINFSELGLDLFSGGTSCFTIRNLTFYLTIEVSLCDFQIREIGNPNKSHRYTGKSSFI